MRYRTDKISGKRKLASSDARNLLILAETMQFQENLQIEVKPNDDKK